MQGTKQTVIADARLKALRCAQSPVACVKPTQSDSQETIAEPQNKTALPERHEPGKPLDMSTQLTLSDWSGAPPQIQIQQIQTNAEQVVQSNPPEIHPPAGEGETHA